MNDSLIPIIETRIRYLGQEMVQTFAARINELKPYVEKAVEIAFSGNNIQKQINEQVNEVIKDCIKNALGSFEVRQELEKIIKNEVVSKLRQDDENSNDTNFEEDKLPF